MSRAKVLGFGYVPIEDAHYFAVALSRQGSIYLYQCINAEKIHVATLTCAQWTEIAQPVAAEFNQRLARDGYAYGRWKIGETPLRATLGKELLLLARAIEDADPHRISHVLKCWRNLDPCERWWLCTQSNAVHEGPDDARKGWRMAIKYALGAIV